jgi:hypothetical protein
MQDLHGTMKDDLSALTTSGKATCTAFGMRRWLAAWQRNWQHVLRWSSHASHHVRVVARCGVYRATLSALTSLRSHGRCESDSGRKVQHHRERARRLVEALLEAEEAPSGHAAAA